MTNQITILAPAKVNVTLSVTGRDEAGYHKLVSAVVFTSFGDHIHLTPSSHTAKDPHAASAMTMSLSGPFAEALHNAGGDDLIQQALALASEMNSASDNYDVYDVALEKNIPLGGGLGGGSADAGAILRHVSCDLSEKQTAILRQKSLSLGADVPVCFDSFPQIMTGKGEVAHPVQLSDDVPFIVLANPHCHANTKEIFAQFHHIKQPYHPIEAADVANILASSDWQNLFEIGNDLTKPACDLYPEITALLDEMSGLGSAYQDDFIGRAMSGSGASCFALFHDLDAAKAYAQKLREKGLWAVASRFYQPR